MRKIRSHYPSPAAFIDALTAPGEPNAIQVYTTEAFDPGEEVLLEVHFGGLPGKMIVRAIGQEWHSARPRLRVRAGGVLRCTGTEWQKMEFLRKVAVDEIPLTARRRHVRLPVMVEVRWRRDTDTESQPGALSELSEGGALLLTPKPLTRGEDIIIEVMPPGSERALEIKAIVRNVDNPEGCGLEFLARDMGGVHRLRELIRRIVEQ